VEYTAQKDKPDFATHGFGYLHHYDTLIRPQLTEFNNAYLAMAVFKLVLHVTITLKDFQIKDKHSSAIDNYFPRPPDLQYLWHYSYEKNDDASKICCDTDYIDSNCLTYVKRFPRNNTIRHRITWYFKPRQYARPADHKFENLKMEDLAWLGMAEQKLSSSPVVLRAGT
jgi:hypothetical protein